TRRIPWPTNAHAALHSLPRPGHPARETEANLLRLRMPQVSSCWLERQLPTSRGLLSSPKTLQKPPHNANQETSALLPMIAGGMIPEVSGTSSQLSLGLLLTPPLK